MMLYLKGICVLFVVHCLLEVNLAFELSSKNLYVLVPTAATSSISTIAAVKSSKSRCAGMCSQSINCCNFHYESATTQCLIGKVTECLGGPLTINGWKYYARGHSFGNKFYFFFDTIKTWQNAKAFCNDHGMSLVSVESEEENAFVKSIVTVTYGRATWLGGNDMAVEGTWVWEGTGQSFTYTDWWISTSQPNQGTASNCMCYYVYEWSTGQSFHWADEDCSSLSTFVCETV